MATNNDHFKDMTSDMHVIGCRGCCVYPNGKIGIAAIVVSVIAFVMAIPPSHGCAYFKQSYSYSTSDFYGLFSFQSADGSCVVYPDSVSVTRAWTFARAMAILATIIGAIALGFTLSLSCVSMPNLMLKCISLALLLAGACLILTLTANANSDCEDCTLAGGGILAIVATFLYFVAAVLVFKIPLYNNDDESPAPCKSEQAAARTTSLTKRGTTTVVITQLPDGSTKTVKTTIDEYGNKTIEETIEEPADAVDEEEPEEDVSVRYLPDGAMRTTRITYDEEGNKIVEQTIEQAAQV